ncbi:MAG: ExeM/NucH family extracellular endonuclease [Pseudomonadota bacterium]
MLLTVLLPALAASLAIATAQYDRVTVSVHAVQGTGERSPLKGAKVRVQGVVTGDFQDYGGNNHGKLGGFYIASLEPDDEPASSEGLFVFEKGRRLLDVVPGQVVEVEGVVAEHFGETQLAASAVRILGSAEYEAVALEFPQASLERFEGMLVHIPERLTIAGNRNLERFGELRLSAGERPYQFTNRFAPSRSGYAASEVELERSSLLLDDGLRRENPKHARYAGGPVPPRAGNSITGLTGTLRWSRGSGGKGDAAFRLMPTAGVTIDATNPRPPPPERSGSLRVASFNLLNLFSGLATGEENCGPDGKRRCRGADSPLELERQLQKTVATFAQLDADIVGIMEIENNARESLRLLQRALRADGQDFEFVDAGVIGHGSIKVAFMYRPERVATAGEFSLLTRAVDGRFDDRRNRPALEQTFVETASGARISVVVNHLKSKGSDCDDANDPNRGDGQGNCNRTRTQAAAALAEWSGRRADASADGHALIIGDLNAYMREDPVRAIERGGFVNLLDRDIGDKAYSFVYDGRAGALDYALASPALAAKVRQVAEWHINADEPPLLDYNLDFGRDATLFDAGAAWRSSDHDPVIVDIDLATNSTL